MLDISQKNKLESIYVSFPDLDDTETITTVVRALENAKYPSRVHFGIAFQSFSDSGIKKFLKKTKKYKNQISTMFVDLDKANIKDAVRVGEGRRLSHSMYKEQDYMLQIDSHTYLAPNWDETLISLHKEASEKITHKKVILTAYAGAFEYKDKRKTVWFPENNGKFFYPKYTQEKKRYDGGLLTWESHEIDSVTTAEKFIPCIKFNANFSFGDKNFAKNTGLHISSIFWEEEPIQSVNLFFDNFAFVFPNVEEPLVCHLYYKNINKFGGYRLNAIMFYDGIDISKNVIENYYAYFNDINNLQKIKLYEDYAHVNFSEGLVETNFMPDKF